MYPSFHILVHMFCQPMYFPQCLWLSILCGSMTISFMVQMAVIRLFTHMLVFILIMFTHHC